MRDKITRLRKIKEKMKGKKKTRKRNKRNRGEGLNLIGKANMGNL